MAASQLEQAIATFREQLLAYDGRALGAVLATYEPIQKAILGHVREIMRIATETPSADPLELPAIQSLLAQIDAELATLTTQIGPLASTAQAVVVNEAGGYQKHIAILSADTPERAAALAAAWTTQR